mgnify:CR=1 FL=1
MIKTQVAIIGAGPVGCVAAYYLAQNGIDVVLAENGPACAAGLRASTFHPPTLEMLDPLGVTDDLIGADGSNSIVRKLMGVEFDGFTYPEKFLCLTTEEPLEEHLENLALVNYVSDPKEWAVLLRVPSLWRVLVPADSDVADSDLLSDAKKEAVFGGLINKPEVETHHRTIYRVHQRVAKNFRKGRVSIIGDSAHLNNPLGGFGMNSGILKEGANADPLLSQFDRERQTQTHDFVQAQTKLNMAYMREGASGEHGLRKAAMQKLVDNADERRALLLRQSMIESVREAQLKAA